MTMLERVAAAIASGWLEVGRGPLDEKRWYALHEHTRMVLLNEARVAIAALREPTDEMIKAGDAIVHVDIHGSAHIWDAMIDAALS